MKFYLNFIRGGKNKTLLDNEGSTLVITEDLAGMYIGFQVIPKAASGSDPVGSPVLLISKDKVGDTQVNAGEAFTLAVEESFTEDFEATVGQEKNLLFVCNPAAVDASCGAVGARPGHFGFRENGRPPAPAAPAGRV